MPSILVQIQRRDQSKLIALMLTVVGLGFFDHTLDGILDVVGLFFLDLNGLFNFNVTARREQKEKRLAFCVFCCSLMTYSSWSDILVGS